MTTEGSVSVKKHVHIPAWFDFLLEQNRNPSVCWNPMLYISVPLLWSTISQRSTKYLITFHHLKLQFSSKVGPAVRKVRFISV